MKLLQDGYQAQMRGQLEDAARAYRKLLQKAPDAVDAIHLLAMVRGKQGRYEDSIRLYRDALRRRPDDAKLWYNLGLICNAADLSHEAGNAYAEAVARDPATPECLGLWFAARRRLCDWSDHARLTAALEAGADPAHAPASPFDTLMLDDPDLQLAVARRRMARSTPERVDAITERAPGRLRIGYLSADFREHPVTHLLVRLLERHDRSRFEVVALSVGIDDGSTYRARVRQAADRFIDCAGDDLDALARRIRDAGIDILVDLMGHTGGNRVDLYSRRLAPVQVSYLGYPGTTGAAGMDYVIADAATLPLSDAATFSEQVVHLPDTYQPCDPDLVLPPTPDRAACGLPEEGVVFCAFNSPQKIDPAMFDVWMGLLRQVPGSVLWLLAAPAAEANVRREAQARDVSPERLVFAPRAGVAEHLARVPLADLFLDTFPYTAHTTANDMLRMGVPVVTLRGRTFASRVAASLVTLMGCPELVTQDAEAYVALALDLARDPARRAALRARLADARATSPLFRLDRYSAHLEAAYEEMVDRWQRGLPPAAFSVPPVA
ncbi:tetratricopeptide repeat protein [Aquabacter cavernae]|uniref:O-linked N-acetylglucosamine transferase, SPINDLY family protein n=1 Tax=Aquabacter cavernae TaxID=2496029 RepID=UPI000F8CF620|nr:tetratricopeptide repeat protein [Aquabacter cavernae]